MGEEVEGLAVALRTRLRGSPPLRGDTPCKIKKLMDRSRIPDPDGKNASIAAENARIDHQNLQNEIERSALAWTRSRIAWRASCKVAVVVASTSRAACSAINSRLWYLMRASLVRHPRH